ncbi:MAG: glycosyltransferase family 2 protein [Candidatus Omnitrophica bacterium]|nr:glycosyltransferase family 2 protein [Candidatus Omnitrophota bacterium]
MKGHKVQALKEKISIIIPVFNEEKIIEKSLKEVVSTFEDFGYPFEIILFDDGSNDRTYEIAKEFFLKGLQNKLIIKRNLYNFGKGRALKKAFRYCSGDYIVWLDADMDLHPSQLQLFFDIMRINNADCVIGSKFHANSVINFPLLRRIISLSYYLLTKILFNLPCHDTQTGIKLFKSKVLKRALPRVLVKKFAFDLEVLVNIHRLGFKIAEAPVILNSQRKYSRIGLQSICKTLWDTLAVFYRTYILRYYDRIDYFQRKNINSEFN